MSIEKKYWKGVEDLTNDPAFVKSKQNEFPEEIPVDEFLGDEKAVAAPSSRRDFLKFLGFSVAAASLASCEAPVRKSIPYLVKPEEVTPGVSNWYATTYFDGYDYCDIIVKTREGRPIKIEGNKLSPITKGGTSARVQASVLSLYDSGRIKGPYANKKPSSWDVVDKEIASKLNAISEGSIVLLSSSIISPATKQAIAEFTAKYPNTKHVTYDAYSFSGMLKANKAAFGKAVLPSYAFDKAAVIVSFGADFLANWISPVEYAAQYAVNRKVNEKNTKMSRHIQVETALSVTGSNADKRISIKPSQQGVAILNLYNKLAALAGEASYTSAPSAIDAQIDAIAKELWDAKGRSLVVCGSNDENVQLIVNAINKVLGNYGNTIDIERPAYYRQGIDSDVLQLVDDMKAGKVAALITYNTNPAYTLPASVKFTDALAKVGLKISFADRIDETATHADYVCPDHHYFESWNDAQPVKGHFALTQPVIAPLFDTRQAQESLLKWAGIDTNYHEYLKKYWEKQASSQETGAMAFNDFWNGSLQKGIIALNTVAVHEVSDKKEEKKEEKKEDKKDDKKNKEGDKEKTEAVTAAPALTASAAAAAIVKSISNSDGFELVLYEKTGMGIGIQANNPWLQEMPDPVTKATWDNYVTMSPKQMKEMGFNTLQGQEQEADLVKITANNITLQLPVLALPGQAYGTIGVALGYGRTNAGKTANNVGANAFQLAGTGNGSFSYEVPGVSVSGSVGKYHLATTQTHHTMMGRHIVKETSLASYAKDPSSGNPPVMLVVKGKEGSEKKPAKELNLWEDYKDFGQLWNLSIDLNSCIGCGNCVISCHAENNVAVVGKDEVRRGRDMHWMRIDRYYTSDAPEDDLTAMEVPSENPQVVFQPVMCQHCNHAPCETVCPVIATSHSTDGLNQMTYNRCVGTRYCANNCPYKVRRFNWFNYSNNNEFDYHMNDDLGKMVLNPDVVVRTRGVMEKCSMCVQRVQEAKLKAKNSGRPLKDGEIETACSQSCPTRAITFGNISDPESEVSQQRAEKRSYLLIEEVGTKPNVFYLTKVRNV